MLSVPGIFTVVRSSLIQSPHLENTAVKMTGALQAHYIRVMFRLADGEVDGKGRAFAHRGGDLYATAMRLDDGPNETETKPKPALRTASVASIKPLPDTRPFVIGNSDAGVADDNSHLRTF